MTNPDLELKTLLSAYRLSCQAEGKSPATIKWYMPFLARFEDYLERQGFPTSVDRVDRRHVRSFIGYLQSEAKVPHSGALLSPATVQGYVRTIKAFFSWLEREEYLATNPLRQLPAPRIPVKVINTFTPEDIAALMEVARRSDGPPFRNLALLLLPLDTGLRVSELVGIEMPHVDLAGGWIKITHAKGSRERLVPIGSVVQRLLSRYIHSGRPRPLSGRADYLFLNSWGTPLTKNGVQQMVRRWGRRAGLTHVRCSPHTFRHTFAKNYLVNGGDVFTLQRILGHTTLACVRLYVNMFAADVKRQHGRCSPADNLAATSGQASRWLGPAGGPRITREKTAREDRLRLPPATDWPDPRPRHPPPPGGRAY